jgi:hypothetical protein
MTLKNGFNIARDRDGTALTGAVAGDVKESLRKGWEKEICQRRS